jgi:hypothetical protein
LGLKADPAQELDDSSNEGEESDEHQEEEEDDDDDSSSNASGEEPYSYDPTLLSKRDLQWLEPIHCFAIDANVSGHGK